MTKKTVYKSIRKLPLHSSPPHFAVHFYSLYNQKGENYMTFYQELQLSSVGSKQLIHSKIDKKDATWFEINNGDFYYYDAGILTEK